MLRKCPRWQLQLQQNPRARKDQNFEALALIGLGNAARGNKNHRQAIGYYDHVLQLNGISPAFKTKAEEGKQTAQRFLAKFEG